MGRDLHRLCGYFEMSKPPIICREIGLKGCLMDGLVGLREQSERPVARSVTTTSTLSTISPISLCGVLCFDMKPPESILSVELAYTGWIHSDEANTARWGVMPGRGRLLTRQSQHQVHLRRRLPVGSRLYWSVRCSSYR